VTFEGAYTKLRDARLGLLPSQQPHPPLEMGAQSVGATRRAARLVDAVFFGPQVAWADLGRLVGVYREARAVEQPRAPGTALASRSLIVGPTKEAAQSAARTYLERTFTMYRTWQMQEPSMVRLQLGFDASLDDWTINGTPAQCRDTIARAGAMGLDGIGLTIYSLPRDVAARIDYLRMIADEIVRPAAALGR
jgi:alkanesulfonate monooxygenase SsuD/methylene tetrahydromethanopterin reductase-like flavin-dependent oxidoreductase (luciferase family)